MLAAPQTNRTITVLDLSNNVIDYEGCTAIATALARSSQLSAPTLPHSSLSATLLFSRSDAHTTSLAP